MNISTNQIKLIQESSDETILGVIMQIIPGFSRAIEKRDVCIHYGFNCQGQIRATLQIR